MAEFLIYNKAHWMDALTDKEIAAYVEKHPGFMDAYNGRHQRGDVIEVRPDGFYTKEKKYRKDTFAVVSIPKMSVEDANEYGKALYDEEHYSMTFDPITMEHGTIRNPKMIKQSKYSFGAVTDKTVYQNITDASIVEKALDR